MHKPKLAIAPHLVLLQRRKISNPTLEGLGKMVYKIQLSKDTFRGYYTDSLSPSHEYEAFSYKTRRLAKKAMKKNSMPVGWAPSVVKRAQVG